MWWKKYWRHFNLPSVDERFCFDGGELSWGAPKTRDEQNYIFVKCFRTFRKNFSTHQTIFMSTTTDVKFACVVYTEIFLFASQKQPSKFSTCTKINFNLSTSATSSHYLVFSSLGKTILNLAAKMTLPPRTRHVYLPGRDERYQQWNDRGWPWEQMKIEDIFFLRAIVRTFHWKKNVQFYHFFFVNLTHSLVARV